MPNVSQPDVLTYAGPESRPPSRWGKGFLAVCGSQIAWGVGHCIAGRARRGAGWFVLWVALLVLQLGALFYARLTPVLLVSVPLQWLLCTVMLIDAFLCGRRSSNTMLARPLARYAVGALLLLLAAAEWSAATTQLRDHLAQGFVLSTRSMAPTFIPGDRILVSKRPFEPKRWDLVAMHPPERPSETYVRRIVGLPGERVEIVGKKMQINGKVIHAPAGAGPYLGILPLHQFPGPGCQGNPITLGPDEYYLLGDNSRIAGDARYSSVGAPGHQPGALPRAMLVGPVSAIYWPPDRWRIIR
jgi:signal peptidase I